MRTRNKLIATFGIVSMLGLGGAALARPPGGPGGGPGGHGGPGGGIFGMLGPRFGKLLQKLELTEQQEDLLFEVRQDMRKQRKTGRQAHLQTLDTVIAELDKPQPDAAKIKKAIDANIEQMRKNMYSGVDGFMRFHQSLDAKQRQELVHQLRRVQKHADQMDD